MEALSTLGLISVSSGVCYGIMTGVDVTGAIILGFVFSLAFSLLKKFYRFVTE